MTGGSVAGIGIDPGPIDIPVPILGDDDDDGRLRSMGSRTGNRSVKAGAASTLAPNVAERGPTDWSTQPSPSCAPTRHGRGDLPSIEINAAPRVVP